MDQHSGVNHIRWRGQLTEFPNSLVHLAMKDVLLLGMRPAECRKGTLGVTEVTHVARWVRHGGSQFVSAMV